MIKWYVKLQIVFINIKNLIKLLIFTNFLYSNNIFRDGNPKLILKVIQKFLEIESSNYSSSIVNSRSVTKSTELISSLIDSYMESSSQVTLEQILEVLKIEFIERR